MKIEYSKPWILKSIDEDQNIVTRDAYSISLTFKVTEDYKKDTKIGFMGIPGKNFGISYDYDVNYFVFEFWTKQNNGEDKFNYKLYNEINPKIFSEYTNITIQFDGRKYRIYLNYELLDIINDSTPLSDVYKSKPLYFGCHNIESMSDKHKCLTDMDLKNLLIFEGVVNINKIESIIKKESEIESLKEFDKLYCYYDLSNPKQEFSITDNIGKKTQLKKKTKISIDEFVETKQKLDSVGCGFCLAKWTQVTMHLHNGTTHSCHHPAPHKVPLEELKRNHTALHNSMVKKYARKEMLENKRPSECSYCWNVEDNSDSYSDRIFKSAEPWSEPYFDEIKDSNWGDDFNPKYVEVNFSNACNFKCAYCGPEYSTKWMEEVNKFGGYDLSFNYNAPDKWKSGDNKIYKQTEHNPYVETFWKWFPELYESMDTFRITGGEPLLSKDTWSVLDFIINHENPNKNLKLSINTNLGVTDDLIDNLILKLEKIISEDRVKEVILFTSCDAYGKQAEYVRYGLNFEQLFSNINKILTVLDKVTIVVMSTFNIFSIFSYEKLIKEIHSLKLKHFNTKRYWNSAIILDTSYLRYPQFLSFRLLKDYLNPEYFERCEKYMKFNSTYRSLKSYEQQTIDDVGFSHKEIEKITRIKDIFLKDAKNKETQFENEKKDFVKFIKQYEERREMKCVDYYPELVDFIKKIEDEN